MQYSVSPSSKEVWECTGTLSLAPWQEYDEDESYISVAQRLELQFASNVVQIGAFQAEPPIIILMTGSPVSRVVWSSSQYRRKYLIEARGCQGTGIALVGHATLRSSVIYFFVDIYGAINVGRLASGSSNGIQLGEHYPIPLDSMRLAFVWAISPVNLDTSTRPSVHPRDIPENTMQSSTGPTTGTSPPTSAPSHIHAFSGRSLESREPSSSQLVSAIEIGASGVSRQPVSPNPYQRGHLPRGSFTLSRSRPSSIYTNDSALPIGTTEETHEVADDSAVPPAPTSHPSKPELAELAPETCQLSKGEDSSTNPCPREETDNCCQPNDCGNAEPNEQPYECGEPPESNTSTECNRPEENTSVDECQQSDGCSLSPKCIQSQERDVVEDCNKPQQCDGSSGEQCDRDDQPEVREIGEECSLSQHCNQHYKSDIHEDSAQPQDCDAPKQCDPLPECNTSDERDQSEKCDQVPEGDGANECNRPPECEEPKGCGVVESSDPLEGCERPKDGKLLNGERDQSEECGTPVESHHSHASEISPESNPPVASDQPDEYNQNEKETERDTFDNVMEPEPSEQCELPNNCEQPKESSTSTERSQPEVNGPHIGGDQFGEDKQSTESDQSEEREIFMDPSQPESRSPHERFELPEEPEEPLDIGLPKLRDGTVESSPSPQPIQIEEPCTDGSAVAEAPQEKTGRAGEPEQAANNPWETVENSTPRPPMEIPATLPKQPSETLSIVSDAEPNPILFKTFADILYERIENAVKPNGSQYFSLQLPARDLQREGFDLRLFDAYSHLEEPGMRFVVTFKKIVTDDHCL